MRKSALAGLFAVVAITTSTATASAQTLGPLQINDAEPAAAEPISYDSFFAALLDPITVEEPVEVPAPEPEPEPEKPAPKPVIIKHEVAENESLISIARDHKTTWQRLFYKNAKLENPNILTIGQELVIPSATEKLKERPIPEPIVEQPAARDNTSSSVAPQPTAYRTRGSSSGNMYTAGYCTWYVKERRPDLPNNLGDAYEWVRNARAQGIATGSTPRTGAVGQRNNHVVYVERVNGDGTITISEMNYRNRYEKTTRVVSADYFTYIYW